jgi:hypothetical protein
MPGEAGGCNSKQNENTMTNNCSSDFQIGKLWCNPQSSLHILKSSTAMKQAWIESLRRTLYIRRLLGSPNLWWRLMIPSLRSREMLQQLVLKHHRLQEAWMKYVCDRRKCPKAKTPWNSIIAMSICCIVDLEKSPKRSTVCRFVLFSRPGMESRGRANQEPTLCW